MGVDAVNPTVPICLLALTALLWLMAALLDFRGRYRYTAGLLAALGFITFVGMLTALGAVIERGRSGAPPVPAPSASAGPVPACDPEACAVAPAYHPETCVDLAWLDGRWTCISRDEAG